MIKTVPLYIGYDEEKTIFGMGNSLAGCLMDSASVVAENILEPVSLKYASVKEPDKFVFFLSTIGNFYESWRTSGIGWKETNSEIEIFYVGEMND